MSWKMAVANMRGLPPEICVHQTAARERLDTKIPFLVVTERRFQRFRGGAISLEFFRVSLAVWMDTWPFWEMRGIYSGVEKV